MIERGWERKKREKIKRIGKKNEERMQKGQKDYEMRGKEEKIRVRGERKVERHKEQKGEKT